MKAVKSLFPAICLTIIGTASVRPVWAADTIQQCVAEVCRGTSPAVSVGAFLTLEKTVHPKVDELFSRYQAQLDQIRVAREKQVRESLKVLSETQKVTDLIRRMSDQELISLFVERKPWNLGTDRINGEYAVVAVPLTSNTQDGEIIKQIFARLQAVSPLYAAQLKVDQINAEPRAALQIPENQKIDSYVLGVIRTRIAQLPLADRPSYTQKLNLYLSRLANFKNQYGDKVYLWFGSLDLELQVKLGRVPFVAGERAVIEKIMIDEIPGIIQNRKDGIAKIDQIYSKASWDKTCRASYNRALHYGLTQTEKDRLENQMKPEALRRSEATVRGLFGKEMSDEIMGYVRTLRIGGPMSLPEYIAYIEQNMGLALEEAQKSNLSLLEQYEFVNSLGNGQDVAIESFCNMWIFDPIRDSVQGNNVILSAYSAKNYAVGLSISIHEMGHAVSIALDLLKRRGVSIAPYEEIRACISENYKASDRKPVYDHSHFNADKLWTEEDWADSFSGHSLQDFKVNDMCGLIGAYPQFDYVTLANRSGGPHSPTFYRILNIDAHLGNQQPNQCRMPLQSDFEGTTFKDCISPFIRK